MRKTKRQVVIERLGMYCPYCLEWLESSLPRIVEFPEPGHLVESMHCPCCECMVSFATDRKPIVLKEPKKNVIPIEVYCICGCDHITRSVVVGDTYYVDHMGCVCPEGTPHKAMSKRTQC